MTMIEWYIHDWEKDNGKRLKERQKRKMLRNKRYEQRKDGREREGDKNGVSEKRNWKYKYKEWEGRKTGVVRKVRK